MYRITFGTYHKYSTFETNICKEMENVPYKKWPNLKIFPHFQKSIQKQPPEVFYRNRCS